MKNGLGARSLFAMEQLFLEAAKHHGLGRGHGGGGGGGHGGGGGGGHGGGGHGGGGGTMHGGHGGGGGHNFHFGHRINRGGRGFIFQNGGWWWGDWAPTYVVYIPICPDGYFLDDYGNCVDAFGNVYVGMAGVASGLAAGLGDPPLHVAYDPTSMPSYGITATQPNIHVPYDPTAAPSSYGSSRMVTQGDSRTSWRMRANPANPIGRGLRGIDPLSFGLGAAPASPLTVQAAKNLDAQLAQSGCAGCDDFTSQLRQLTFTFKAAVLTDPVTMNDVSLNMSTPLAMTGYGPGTDKAMALVLGAFRHYQAAPCTDDQGNCTMQGATPALPPSLVAAGNAFQTAVVTALAQIQNLPVAQLASMQQQMLDQLTALAAGFVNQVGFAVQQTKAAPTPATPNQPNPITPTTPQPLSTASKFLIGGAIGAAVVGTTLIIYHAGKKS